MPAPRFSFPDPRLADEHGIIAVSEHIHPEMVLIAYQQGIFPWPIDQNSLIPWCCPKERGVLEFKNLHISRSLKKILNRTEPLHFEKQIVHDSKNNFRVTLDQDFEGVITACAKVHAQKGGTWITPEMIRSYIKLHQRGITHSVEVWRGKNLVGGVYGVDCGGVFSAESMFHLVPNASKIALVALVQHLERAGAKWMDIQMVTPHTQKMGGHEILRNEFLTMLKKTLKLKLKLF